MKKQFTTKMKMLTAIGVLSTISVTAIAGPILQEVSATLRKDITFTLNGEKTLEDANVLIYENSTYLPLRALGEELGIKIEYTDGQIKMTNSANGKSKAVEMNTEITDLTPALKGVHIPNAVIKEINTETNQITILPSEAKDEVTNYIILTVGKETKLGELKLEDLKVGMTISATHSEMMTRSMPPQTPALEIKVIEEVAPLENITLKGVVITEISEDKKSITVGPILNKDDRNAQMIVHIDEEKTAIKHEKNRRLYTAVDLEVGQKLTIIHAPSMTLSLPPQTSALEIILVD